MRSNFFRGEAAERLLKSLEQHDEKALAAMGVGKLDEISWIDLSGASVSALPAEIWRLTNLHVLILRETQLSALPAEIGRLKNLQQIVLRGTKISALPAEIAQLTHLKQLDLSQTKIAELPPKLEQLTSLQELSLNGTLVSVLPPKIGLLRNLQTLDLSRTKILSLPSEIRGLTNLKTLDLSETQISELPPEIGRLTNLYWLYLNETGISSLPAEIKLLTNLKTLDLSGTGIAALPAEIGSLKQLLSLVFDRTAISELPEFLCGLTNLRTLSLSGTKIHTIPPWIKLLKSLKNLRISNLTLKEIPPEVFHLGLPFNLGSSKPKGVVMENTVLKTQPISLFGLDRALIRAYYEAEKIPVREGKVIFLGDAVAGKSHTIERILNDGRDEGINTDMTPGISIRAWEPDCGGKKVKINFWDFGGQEIMHAMHRCFLTGRSLYVVVVRERSQSRHNDLTLQARYWLDNIRSFAPNCPVILAVNRERGSKGIMGINSSLLRERFPSIVCEPIVYCAREDEEDNFEALTKAILDQALLLDSTEMEFPITWNTVRNKLEAMSNRRDLDGSQYYIDKEKYKELCIAQGITDEKIQRWLLEWFNDLGVCFSYHQEEGKELERYQVLNPEWLTNAIYAIIIIGSRQRFSDNGVISFYAIDRILSKEIVKDQSKRTAHSPISYEDDEQVYVLDIMKKFNLCAQLDQKSFFIPALCSPKTPEGFRPGEEVFSDHTRFEFRYGFLPDSVIHRLMIECIQAGFHLTDSYLCGLRVDFQSDEVVLTAEADIAKDALSIDVYHKNEPYLARMKLSWIRNRIAEINTAMNLKPDNEVLVVCKGEDRADLDLDFLFALYESGEKSVHLNSYRKGRPIKYELKNALRLLYSDSKIEAADGRINRSAGEKMGNYRDVFDNTETEPEFLLGVSFAGEQREFVEQVCKKLCEQGRFDEDTIFYDKWHEHRINGKDADSKLENIYSRQCKKIVVLLSEAYQNKPWPNNVEWPAITNRLSDVCLLCFGKVDLNKFDGLDKNKDVAKDVIFMTPEQTAIFIQNWYNRREKQN